eukprot:139299-Alexandrium_andersonii.AAC.1
MSASLVGSEMCIRDSVDSHASKRFADHFECCWASWAGPPERARFDLEPVSYTHLTLPTICSV